MGFPSVASSSTTSGTSSGISVTLPSGVTSGDLLVLIAGFDGSGGSETQDPDIFVQEAGWTRASMSHAGRVCSGAVFWKVATGSDAATVDLQYNVFGEVGNVIALRITGHGSEVEATAAIESGTSTTPDPPSITPSWGAADTLWIAAAVVDNGTKTFTADPSGYSGGVELGSTSAGVAVRSVTKAANAASENPGSFTINFADQWNAFTIAVKPAGGGAPSLSSPGVINVLSDRVTPQVTLTF